MCGRYQRRSDKQRIADAFAVGNVEGLALELAPTYNTAPQSMQPVIIWDLAGGTRWIYRSLFWSRRESRIFGCSQSAKYCLGLDPFLCFSSEVLALHVRQPRSG